MGRVRVADDAEPARPLCCGRTYLSLGQVDAAREEARRLHAALAQLRATEPISRVEVDGYAPFWVITKHADIMEIERANDVFTNSPRPVLITREGDEQQAALGIRSLIHTDDPLHRDLRAIGANWFRPKAMRALKDRADELAKRFVDKMAAEGPECDFVQQVAVNYPLYMIMTLLGVPESDFGFMLKLTQELFGSDDDEFKRGATVEEQGTTVDPAVTEPTTAPVEVEPVAALVAIDPVAEPGSDPGAPTMRLAAMQPLAAPQLFSAAAPTLTTPFVPTVIQAPPTVGPIATAVLDILASLGWRASPLAVAVFPSLYPWSAGAAVPTPVDAVYTPSGAPPTTAPYVLVGHSTLDIPCGPTTYSARVDWYFPAQDAAGTVDPQGMIWVQNGFLANSGFYTALATNLSANTNSIVVVPTITSNPFSCFGCWLNGPSMQAGAASLFTGNRQALLDSAVAAGYVGAGLPAPFILSGHSAGGGFAAATAGYFINNPQANIPDLKGVVMFDGVPGIGVLSSVAPQLRANDIPIYQIAAQNQIWNVWGSGTNELVATNPGGFNGVVIYHGSHVDSMLGGNPIVDFFAQLVTQFSPPGATQAVYTYADGWINDMYTPGSQPVGPLYPGPNQPVQIGPALTYGLPSPTGQRSRLGELIYGIITFFSSLFGA